jgi:hypothetical protein
MIKEMASGRSCGWNYDVAATRSFRFHRQERGEQTFEQDANKRIDRSR